MNYDERQQFEHELINRRLTWLLSSQTILFASLAFVLHKDTDKYYKQSFTDIVSYLGIAISFFIFIGVLMGIIAKFRSFRDERNIQKKRSLQEYNDNPVQWGVRTRFTRVTMIPDMLMPLAFAAAWIFILCKLS